MGFNGYKDVTHGSKNGRIFSSQGNTEFQDHKYYFYLREVLTGTMALILVTGRVVSYCLREKTYKLTHYLNRHDRPRTSVTVTIQCVTSIVVIYLFIESLFAKLLVGKENQALTRWSVHLSALQLSI